MIVAQILLFLPRAQLCKCSSRAERVEDSLNESWLGMGEAILDSGQRAKRGEMFWNSWKERPRKWNGCPRVLSGLLKSPQCIAMYHWWIKIPMPGGEAGALLSQVYIRIFLPFSKNLQDQEFIISLCITSCLDLAASFSC